MKYLDFREHLKDYIVFSVGDIQKIERRFYRRRLIEWQKKEYIKKIIKGYYIFSDQPINESVLFIAAEKIYNPSYVSFESALSYYAFIPEGVYAITSASSKKTQKFDTDLCHFVYHQVKPSLMFGYRLVGYNNHRFKMAEPEKAILDYLYINKHLKTKEDFKQLRFNRDSLLKLITADRMKLYLKLFDDKTLENRISVLMKFIKNA